MRHRVGLRAGAAVTLIATFALAVPPAVAAPHPTATWRPPTTATAGAAAPGPDVRRAGAGPDALGPGAGPDALRPGAATVGSAPVRVMALGDSITSGTGSSTGAGYRAPLYQRLNTEADFPVDFVGGLGGGTLPDPDHEGYSGWRIEQVAGRVEAAVRRYRPDVVTVHLGTNDLAQGYRLDTAAERLGALVDRLSAAAPTATVLVASLVPSSDPALQARIDAFNAALPGLVRDRARAGERVRYVGMHSVTAGDLADSLHPNDAGYAKMAAAWYPAVVAAAGTDPLAAGRPLHGYGVA